MGILKTDLRKSPLAPDVNLDAIVTKTDKFTGADLTEIINRADRLAIREAPEKPTARTRAKAEAAASSARWMLRRTLTPCRSSRRATLRRHCTPPPLCLRCRPRAVHAICCTARAAARSDGSNRISHDGIRRGSGRCGAGRAASRSASSGRRPVCITKRSAMFSNL